jgi:hypothetical protein
MYKSKKRLPFVQPFGSWTKKERFLLKKAARCAMDVIP